MWKCWKCFGRLCPGGKCRSQGERQVREVAEEVAPKQVDEAEVKEAAERERRLSELSAEERAAALQRYELLRPCLEAGVSVAEVARSQDLPLKSVQRWVQRYRQEGLVGLARRRRSDRGMRRSVPQEGVQVIEGLALTRPKRSVAEIHRTVSALAKQRGWPEVSYSSVYAIVQAIDPQLVVLAQEGSRAYQEVYDLLYLQEVERPNERWQADHCLLNIWLVNDQGKPTRPYLTIILDEWSRAVMGYRLSFEAPSASQTGLTLRQAIWKKEDGRWPARGIPETFYTDHGSDFTSQRMEQVAAQLSMQLIFSQVGRPRGRGKIERFFRTVKQIVLPRLPGYIPRERRSYRSARKRQRGTKALADQAKRQARMTLAEFDVHFRTWVLETYHHRSQSRLQGTPLARWQAGNWLPRLPRSLSDLDLLLLREAKTRQVQQEGIRFQGYRYVDVKLAGYVRSTVVIYSDPLDLRTIMVYASDGPTEERFLCQARCQDLGEEKVSLKELVTARNAERKELQRGLKERREAVRSTSGAVATQQEAPSAEEKALPQVSRFVPPRFMATLSAEFLRTD
jgi:putative transposase